MKVWLDDERPAPEGWKWVKTAKECIGVLTIHTVTHLSLDHDLLPEHYTANYETEWKPTYQKNTGMDVIMWLERKCANDPHYVLPKIIEVHSQNPTRAPLMRKMIVAIQREYDYYRSKRR